jgi:hypothetical protein
MSLQTGDQHSSDITEADSAGLFVKLCEEMQVKSTLYCTGRLLDEEWDAVRKWAHSEYIEIAGHTYSAFMPALPHRIWKKLTGNYNGPAFMERKDIGRNLDLIEQLIGKKAVSWRNHCYFHGCNTDRLLMEQGITNCSDVVCAPGAAPYYSDDGLVTVPINVIPDHEHIFHGERDKAHVDWWVKRYAFKDAYGSESYDMDTWVEIVLSNIEENERMGVVSVILAHPLCMYVADKFSGFSRILNKAAEYGSCTMEELVADWLKKEASPLSGRKAA